MASEYNEAARIDHRGVLVYVPTKFPWIVDSPKKRQNLEILNEAWRAWSLSSVKALKRDLILHQGEDG